MRTTGVRLVAETGIFRKKIREAAGDVDHLNDELDRTGKGRQLDDQAKHAENLRARIKETETAVVSLARSFAMTGGDDSGIRKQLKQQQRSLRELKQIEKLLPSPGSMLQAGVTMGNRLALGISKSIPPQVTMAIAGVGVAAAPLLATGLAGAVIGGAGIGGIVGGLALARKDARVAAEADSLSRHIGSRLDSAAGVFVRPALDGLREIQRAADTVDVEGIFRDSARLLPALTRGASSAVEDIGNGFEALVSRSGPAVDAISRMVAAIGQQAGESLRLLSDDADEGASAIDDLTLALTNFVQTTVGIVHGLAVIKGGMDSLDGGIDNARHGIEDFFTSMSGGRAEFDLTADGMGVAERKAKELADAQRAAAGASALHAEKMNAAAGAARGELGAMQALSSELRAQTDPAFALLLAQEKLKTAQDNAAEATRKHGRNSIAARQATRDLAAAALDMQAKAGSLAAGFNGRLTPAMRATYRTAGLTESQINDVERELVAARQAADKYSGSYRANVTLSGAETALSKLTTLAAYQDALKRGSSSIASIRKNLSKDNADFLKFDVGGRTPNVGIHEPAGVVHGQEFVLDAKTVSNVDRQAPGFLEQVHARHGLPGYAGGGRVTWPYRVDATKTRIPSAKEVAAKVAPAVPSGGRTSDWIVAAARALVPGVRVISKDRPGSRTLSGNQSYHSLGRAVDFAPSEKLARLWNTHYKARTKELISPYQQYNIHNGQRHRYTGAIWNQHNFAGGNAHDHIAMRGGGTIREPVFGVGRSGTTYSFGEGGRHERVTPIGQGGGASGGTTITVAPTIIIQGANQSPQQIARAVDRQIGGLAEVFERS